MKQIVEHITLRDTNIARVIDDYNHFIAVKPDWEMFGSPMYINNGVYCLVLVRYGDD